MNQDFKIISLGSSSKGNAYILRGQKSALLIECGIPFLEVQKSLNFNTSLIDGCLLSHSHKDHSKYKTEYEKAGIEVTTNLPESRYVEVGSWGVIALENTHDVFCNSFLIRENSTGIVTFFCTDTGIIPYKPIYERVFKSIQYLMIEANHSQKLIIESESPHSGRVFRNHLSIEKVINFLLLIDLPSLKEIYLLHLSDSHSDSNGFKKSIQQLTGIPVYICGK